MKHYILLFVLLILGFTNNQAQIFEWDTAPAFEVWNASGKIKYTTKEGGEFELNSETSIPDEATVTLKKKAILELVYEGQPLPILNEKGTYSLSELKSKKTDQVNSTIMVDFWASVNEAFKGHGGGGIGGGDKGHGGGGIGGGDKGHGGGGIGGGDKGHGGKGGILALGPFGGGLSGGSVNFEWIDKNEAAAMAKGHGGGGIGGGDKGHGGGGIGGGDKGHGGGGIGGGDKGHGNERTGDLFQIILSSKDKDVPLFSALTYQNNFSIDLDQIGLDPNVELFWSVRVVGEDGKSSEAISIQMTDVDKKKSILETLNNDPGFQQASEFQQTLLKAVSFEKNNMQYLAQKKYQKALKAQPNNKVAKWLYDAFLSKNGLEVLVD